MGSLRTRLVTRNKLAEFLKSQELVKVFEGLIDDVSQGLPSMLDEIESLAAGAQALAAASQAMAAAALDIAKQASEGPPPTPVQLLNAPDEGPPAAPLQLPDVPDDVQATIASLRERVSTLERAVAQFSERPTP